MASYGPAQTEGKSKKVICSSGCHCLSLLANALMSTAVQALTLEGSLLHGCFLGCNRVRDAISF